MQSPIMSLYLPEQKLGSHSDPDSSSHKFMLKGRQTGAMHRGHSWVFRAESHDTMMAWYSDVKELTEKTGEARNEFVRRSHARSFSGGSHKAASIGSSEGAMEEDEADKVPYSSEHSVRGQQVSTEAAVPGLVAGSLGAAAIADMEDARSEAGWRPPQQRPAPGGRFESEVKMDRNLQAPFSPSSGESSDRDRDIIAAAGALPGSGVPFSPSPERHTELQPLDSSSSLPADIHRGVLQQQSKPEGAVGGLTHDNSSQYGEWMAPITAGAAVGGLAAHSQEEHAQPLPIEAVDSITRQMDAPSAIPVQGTSPAPIPVIEEQYDVARPRAATGSTQATTLISGVDIRAPTTVTTSSQGDAASGTLSTVPTSVEAPTEGELLRPSLTPTKSSKSVQTVSDLHVPGEYPKGMPQSTME